MTDVWLDANVMLRYLLRDNEEMFRQACSLVEQAEAGDICLRLASLAVAEMVWVLESFYGLERRMITQVLTDVIMADGVVAEEKELMLKSLQDYQVTGVDFIDAYLAAKAQALGHSVATFDKKHFKRLQAKLYPE
ncbi:MAG TPA: type II toxin-antitoxin system VapC family toxin [Syntrophothermus lipocalidus]|uniref:PilT protein domain protein n=1 Tax=Syntrophothermus lipocalidus (strain DSM 12680 / TGB-C1) TaxID=643648 RepID=D7CJ95_SYNLT|nr:PIN domain-containing protein [Syntrophothermus lipocalidus]ADI00984.1 PilT protein domain protein [Syntrophothermus lipocalidus DSM 12680]HHV77708.1 type II toxin-antitoxin system VapC family toxin [Syntrophothermus lipocalidus]HOV42455.1 PIN domain-containing protein [Syntrophothermus lipocalidus]